MKQDIIDLTEPVYIDVDAKATPDSSTMTPAPSSGPEREKKRSRRKKRKRTMTDGESASSVTQTREPSPEDREIETKKSKNGLPSDSGKGRHLEKQERRRTPSPRSMNAAKENLFFIDLDPVPLPSAAQPSFVTEAQDAPALLLPTHVSVFGVEPAKILAPADSNSDDDYIDYLDFEDNSRNIVRYFEDPVAESSKTNRTVCKNCGAEGKHTTATCPVMICLTCGARDEHSTRSCPISKTCFTCGMKGHINATCPNRRAARRGELDRYDDCDRCGSELHKANECPTLWRLYEYLTEEAKDLVLRTRKEKQHLNLGEGGEGYIADDEWCYNCGSFGHWGDDCQDVSHREDIPDEYSAFSEHNTLSGPFFDSVRDRSLSKARRRNLEEPNGLPASWGNVPENVGKKGRRNNAAKMERRAEEQTVEDDPDDWFRNSQNARARNRGGTRSKGDRDRKPDPPKKIAFGKSLQDSSRHFRLPSPPKLLDRIGDFYYDQPQSAEHHSRDTRTSRKQERDYGREDRYVHERNRDRDRRDHRRDDIGPRYKGGYLR